MNIKELVKNNKVRFLYYRRGELWYEVIKEALRGEDYPIFVFPVPISDCGEAQFNAEDKAIYMMKWIKKQLDVVEKEKE